MQPFLSTFIVAALGYFVDIYDLILFGVVRVESLNAIGVPKTELLDAGMLLIDCQMLGMLVGGFFWGILSDKKGRTTVMMASILLYSLANFANAFVGNVTEYAVLRFIAGFGLSGEVGAAVTLVSESVHRHQRTLWTTLLTAFGLLGAVTAGLIGDSLHWKYAYMLGGTMGFLLLFLRMRVSESSLFLESKNEFMGKISLIFCSPKRLLRYLACVLVGVPIWYVVGILMTFSPELMKENGMTEVVSAGKAILFCYIGLCVGDLINGVMSHLFKKRRVIIGVSLVSLFLMVLVYLNAPTFGLTTFYAFCLTLGLFGGYWAVYVTMVAENFGTNLRGTAVIMVTNWMRGSVVLMTLCVHWLENHLSLTQSSLLVGIGVLILAGISLFKLPETFGKELGYIET